MEYAVAVAVVLPWVAMVGTTEVATDRTAARAMATTVALAVEAPCTMESRGPCRGNPRISTVARGKTHGRSRKCHGHCRGHPQKGPIMCICEEHESLNHTHCFRTYVLLNPRIFNRK